MSNPAAYGPSKAGLIQSTKWVATLLAPDVRVNSVSPGGDFTGQLELFVDSYNSRTPLGWMATYDDFRVDVTFVATDMAEYVIGQVVNIGGWGVW